MSSTWMKESPRVRGICALTSPRTTAAAPAPGATPRARGRDAPPREPLGLRGPGTHEDPVPALDEGNRLVGGPHLALVAEPPGGGRGAGQGLGGTTRAREK